MNHHFDPDNPRWTRHRLTLLVAGIFHISIGTTYVSGDLTSDRRGALYYALMLTPIERWGVFFIIVGLACLGIAIFWPKKTTAAFMLLTGLSAGWGAFFLIGVISGYGSPFKLASVLTWWTLAFLWWVISGMISPSKLVELTDRLGRESNA